MRGGGALLSPALLPLNDWAARVIPSLDATREAMDMAGEAGTHQVLRCDAATHAAGAVDYQFLAVMGRNGAWIEGGERDQRRSLYMGLGVFVRFPHVHDHGFPGLDPGA